jgi:hypothetical protein
LIIFALRVSKNWIESAKAGPDYIMRGSVFPYVGQDVNELPEAVVFYEKTW